MFCVFEFLPRFMFRFLHGSCAPWSAGLAGERTKRKCFIFVRYSPLTQPSVQAWLIQVKIDQECVAHSWRKIDVTAKGPFGE